MSGPSATPARVDAPFARVSAPSAMLPFPVPGGA